MAEFVDYIPMRLNDPNIQSWDGRSSRVDPGTYDFEIVKVAFDQSRRGNRTLVVSGAVITDGPMKGRNMRNSYVISDDDFARRRMKAVIEATGAVLDEQGGFAAESLVGLHFTADVITDTFDDIDPKTGQPVSREVNKWIGERMVEGEHVAAPTPPQPRAAAPAPAAAGRRPAPPANGGRPAPQR
jgi:hypothetical protein